MRQTNLHTMDWFVSMKSLHIGIDKRLHQHIYSNKVANRGTLCAMPITPFIIIFICYYKLRKKTFRLHYQEREGQIYIYQLSKQDPGHILSNKGKSFHEQILLMFHAPNFFIIFIFKPMRTMESWLVITIFKTKLPQ